MRRVVSFTKKRWSDFIFKKAFWYMLVHKYFILEDKSMDKNIKSVKSFFRTFVFARSTGRQDREGGLPVVLTIQHLFVDSAR